MDRTSPLPQTLVGKKAAILVADNFQIHEAYYPYFRLKEAGAEVFFVGDEAGRIYTDYNGEPLVSDVSVQTALTQEFDFIHCPGGFAPLKLRANPLMLELAGNHFNAGKLFGAICHGGSFLVAMGVLKGRRATGYHTLKDDLINAGADYIDDAPIVDGNLITARIPQDLPAFMEAVVRYLENGYEAAAAEPQSLSLEGTTIGILVEHRYQAHQVWYPYFRLKGEGVQVLLIGQKRRASSRSRISRLSAECDLSVAEALERDLDGLVVPGDWAADKMRTNRSFLEIVQKQFNNGRLLASIAEGHSVLISAKILEGMKVAGLPEMKRDIENCGACQVDQPVYQDKNLVTSRCTDDLPELMRWVLGYLKAR